MIQQINLYRLLPKQTGMYLTREVVWSSYGVLIFIFLLIYFISLFQKHELSNEYSKLQETNNILKNQLAALVTQYPISNPADLKTSLKDLQSQLITKTKIVDSLSPNANFASNLIGIAKSTEQGTWLYEIKFNRTDKKIILKGFTLNRNSLQEFINKLQSQPEFHQLIFSLEEFTETAQPAIFTVSTKQALTYE